MQRLIYYRIEKVNVYEMIIQQHSPKKITAAAPSKKTNPLCDAVRECLEKGYRRKIIEIELELTPSVIYKCYENIGFCPIGMRRGAAHIKPVKIEYLDGKVNKYISRNEASMYLGISPRYVGMLIESGKMHRKGYRLYNC